MYKKLVANPIAGLAVVPARIILEDNRLTIKTGILGKSQTFAYSKIQNVTYSGINSLTLTGSIIVTPLFGPPVEVLGFTKSQYEEVLEAMNGGN